MNETKAFQLLKKSKRGLQVYKDDGYYISDGVLIFYTLNKKKLISLGLIDFSGEPKENSEIIRDALDKWYESTAVQDHENIKYSGVIFEGWNDKFAVLGNEKYSIAVNYDYIGLWDSEKESLYVDPRRKNSPVIVRNNGFLMGMIAPVKVQNEHLGSLGKITKTAFLCLEEV